MDTLMALGIGGFKGGAKGWCPPNVSFAHPIVLADNTGIWEITNKVYSCKSSKAFN